AHAGNNGAVVKHEAGRERGLGPGCGRGGHRGLDFGLAADGLARSGHMQGTVRSKPGPWIAADPMRGPQPRQEIGNRLSWHKLSLPQPIGSDRYSRSIRSCPI
ncbi:MAG TPA: hypothetical protein PK857_07715, partial [Hyphomicrobium sp.]|nr:hypothetical protein [Hyphomicrobium sp.]